jgi:hypothetical protein
MNPTDKAVYSLEPPPRMQMLGELPAVIEPRLRGLPPFAGERIEAWEPFESGAFSEHLTEEVRAGALALARCDERVARLLEGKRYRGIGVSVLGQRRRPGAVTLLSVFYDYTDDVVIEATVDADLKEVSHVAVRHYQPAPLEEEIAHAVAMARKDLRIAEQLCEGMEGLAILLAHGDTRSARPLHRVLDVRFIYPDERLPELMAIVDLSTDTVLMAGRCCRESQGGEEVRDERKW